MIYTERRLQTEQREVVELKVLEGFEVESRDPDIKLKRGGVRITIMPLGDKFIVRAG